LFALIFSICHDLLRFLHMCCASLSKSIKYKLSQVAVFSVYLYVSGVSSVGGSTLKRYGSQSAIGQPSASKQRYAYSDFIILLQPVYLSHCPSVLSGFHAQKGKKGKVNNVFLMTEDSLCTVYKYNAFKH